MVSRWLSVATALLLAGCGGSGGGGGGAASTAAGVSSATPTPTTSAAPAPVPSSAPATPPVRALPLPTGAVGGTRARGIDVSIYQGTIDWAKVRAAGIRFAVARVNHGINGVDASFPRNWAGMKRNGIVRGCYQYFLPQEDPIRQADLLVNLVRAEGGFEAGDLPPVIDVEERGGQSDATINRRVRQWIDRVEARTGLTPMVYTSPGFWDPLGAPGYSDSADLWVAHWGVTAPRVPGSWRDWTFWQTSSTGRVNGINARVDTDLFNGTVNDLIAQGGGDVPRGFFRGLAPDATGRGYWLCGVDGGVFAYGDATVRGSAGAQRHAQPILGMVRTPTGRGYWLFGADGDVTPFGDAMNEGDLTRRPPQTPVCAMAATPTGKGYWLLTRGGRVHAFGDAQDYGEPGSRFATEAVTLAATPTGRGYWVASADGEVLDFGDARAIGDLRGRGIASPVVGLAARPTGRGYWLAQADGTVTAHGDAPALTYGGRRRVGREPVIGIAPTRSGAGYWLVTTDGIVLGHGDAVEARNRPR
jgi:GH25 family lysozyme M1 (1,4-beta-N-acetylmuramidase)